MSKFSFGRVKDTSLLGTFLILISNWGQFFLWFVWYVWHQSFTLPMILATSLYENYYFCDAYNLFYVWFFLLLIATEIFLCLVIMVRNSLEVALTRSVLVVKNMVMVSHLMIVIWHSFLSASWASKLRGSDWFYPWVFFGRYAIVSCEVIWSAVYIVISFA